MASAATGAMSSLLAKLAELLGEDCYQHQMQRGTRREVAFLRDELGSMNALLERLADADAAAPLDPQTREWRDQVREMSYDIEDCVDEYMGQLRRRSGGGGGVVNESRIASKSQDYQRHRANRQEEHLPSPRPFPRHRSSNRRQ